MREGAGTTGDPPRKQQEQEQMRHTQWVAMEAVRSARTLGRSLAIQPPQRERGGREREES